MVDGIKKQFSDVRLDRPYMLLVVAIFALGLIYAVTVIFSLHESQTQVITHYSGVGDSRFYKARWYSLIEFVVFGLALVVAHIALLLKLHRIGYRGFGIVFGWITLTMLVVVFADTLGVIRLAFL